MFQVSADRSAPDKHPLRGKKIFIPRLAYGSALALAAAFRAVGLDADITPPSDHRTLELGGRYTCGDECYPAKITTGDFMKLLERPDIDPARTVLLMATTGGPCRFGQYSPYLRRVLDENGYHQTELLSPSSDDSYQSLREFAGPFTRTAWRAIVAADILRKLLLRYRPYEQRKGEADNVYEECLTDLCGTIEHTPVGPSIQLRRMRESLVRCRDRFRSLDVRQDYSKPLIGIVGEIFCRLNSFSNNDLLRRLEEHGGEGWISDASEWGWYSNSEELRLLKLKGRRYGLKALGVRIRGRLQRRDEHSLLEPFREEFRDRKEPKIEEVIECARPYLPAEGAIGEMVLNIGKTAYLARQGVHGVIDISPFTCMNGIVCEAIYPKLSRDLGSLPIRSFYFDGVQSDLDCDLGVFLELARTYRRHRQRDRS